MLEFLKENSAEYESTPLFPSFDILKTSAKVIITDSQNDTGSTLVLDVDLASNDEVPQLPTDQEESASEDDLIVITPKTSTDVASSQKALAVKTGSKRKHIDLEDVEYVDEKSEEEVKVKKEQLPNLSSKSEETKIASEEQYEFII